MSIDRFPKKPCKTCNSMGHFTYNCFRNPRKAIQRTSIKQQGKYAKQWALTRKTWIKRNPPPIAGRYWECYLRIHPWCPVRIDVRHMTLDHVISRSRAPGLRFNRDNLRPACYYCNNEKGSRSLDQVKPDVVQ